MNSRQNNYRNKKWGQGRNRSNRYKQYTPNVPTHPVPQAPVLLSDPNLLPQTIWTKENAQKAIDAEIEIGLERESIIMTFPDELITAESILSISPAIKHVKFERNICPRSTYVNYREKKDIPEIVNSLNQLTFDGKKPNVEVRSYSGPLDRANITNIDPYILYVSNIDNMGDLTEVKNLYMPGLIIKYGIEEWRKNTYYVHLKFPSVNMAIEALKRNFHKHFRFNNRRLKVRFLRKARFAHNKKNNNNDNTTANTIAGEFSETSNKSSGIGSQSSSGPANVEIKTEIPNDYGEDNRIFPRDLTLPYQYNPNVQIKTEIPDFDDN